MRTLVRTIVLTTALCAQLLSHGCGVDENRFPSELTDLPPADSVTVEIDGTRWTQVMNWDFSDGWYPGSWGWGDWRIEKGVLTGDDPTGRIAVYVFPFTHADNALLETKVRLVRDAENHRVDAQLLTRNNRVIHSESGMEIVADESQVVVRHMVRSIDYVYGFVRISEKLERGKWYTLRFVLRKGRFDAFINDEHVYSSSDSSAADGGFTEGNALAGRAARRAARHVEGRFPASVYTEPHLAVNGGQAEFEYVKIFVDRSVPAPTVVTAREAASSGVRERHWLVTVLLSLFFTVIAMVCIYVVRHYAFTLNRLFGRQRQPYLDVDAAKWPEVTVVVPAHNEEMVIAEVLEALLEVDYPEGKLSIIPVNDRSKDKTGDIIDEFAARHPEQIKPYHRKEGTAGKAAALNDTLGRVETDILLVFDADYVPGRGLIKQLVSPFFDPEVGAVMGRVVPYNVECNLLTRLLDLERAGGYQVDQQARMNMKMVPQYGGTVGGVRKGALESVGGWREDSLAEDTDATYRLLLGGWKTVYQNRSECYEQVPESWTSRLRQIKRWAKGHNQATRRYSFSLLKNRRTRWTEKLDGLLLLCVYTMSPVLIFGWLLGSVLWYLGEPRSSLILIFVVTSYSTLGNFAVFYEITAAAQLDGSRERVRLLPFVFFGFLVSLFSVSRAAFSHIAINGNGKNGKNGEVVWDKTERNNNFNGHTNSYTNGRKNGSNNKPNGKGSGDERSER